MSSTPVTAPASSAEAATTTGSPRTTDFQWKSESSIDLLESIFHDHSTVREALQGSVAPQIKPQPLTSESLAQLLVEQGDCSEEYPITVVSPTATSFKSCPSSTSNADSFKYFSAESTPYASPVERDPKGRNTLQILWNDAPTKDSGDHTSSRALIVEEDLNQRVNDYFAQQGPHTVPCDTTQPMEQA